MAEALFLRDLFWALTTLSEVVLVGYLLRRGLHHSHWVFLLYILTAIGQSVSLFVVYRRWGFDSFIAWKFAWASQAVVVGARWSAVISIARDLLSAYRGIWALAKRILASVSVSVLAYALLFSKGRWYQIVMNAERATELSIASFVVALFLFARYYALPEKPLQRALAIGFGLYSCFCVINFSLFKEWLASYTSLWNFLDVVTFLASVLLWINAVRVYAPPKAVQEHFLVPQETYSRVSAELNLRLRLLNEQLDHLLRSGDQRS